MRVIVIGGGISGLAATHHLLGDRQVSVTLLEASPRLGGKLRTGEIAGSVTVDLGAESMLARRPEGVELAREAGLGELLQPPATAKAAVWTGGALHPLPGGHFMGVPGEPAALAGLVSPAGVARIARDATAPRTPVGDDVAVGAYVAERLGHEVVDRLVEPLLGGVYAGDAYRTSMRAALPQLFQEVRGERSLLAAVRSLQRRAAAGAPGGPVFTGVEGGIGRLPGAVADACRAAGAELRTGVPVRALSRVLGDGAGSGDGTGPARSGRTGWRVELADGAVLTADAVVLAVPAGEAARLLAREAPAAAAELAGVEYASMALVTMAFRRADLGTEPPGSGFLVPAVDGRAIKAATFSSAKWAWVAAQDPDLFVLRASLGRYGEEERLRGDDAELAAAARADLEAATGLAARPVDTVVTRWPDGLPQYPVGHVDRVARVRADLARLPGVTVCGAAYDGVGVPACVASARRAAERTLVPDGPAAG